MTLGHVTIDTKRAAQGIAECEHALALDRNLATAHAFIGLGKIFVGRAEETETHVGEAARLSPRDTSAHAWKTFVGVAKLILGSYEQAVAWFRRAIEANRNYPIPYFLSAAGFAQLGRLDEAHSALKAGLALNPTFAISRARAAWTAMWSSLRPSSKACARPGSRNNDRRPPRAKGGFACGVHDRETSPVGPSGRPSATRHDHPRQCHPARLERTPDTHLNAKRESDQSHDAHPGGALYGQQRRWVGATTFSELHHGRFCSLRFDQPQDDIAVILAGSAQRLELVNVGLLDTDDEAASRVSFVPFARLGLITA